MITTKLDYKPCGEILRLTRLIEDGMSVKEAMDKILKERCEKAKARRRIRGDKLEARKAKGHP